MGSEKIIIEHMNKKIQEIEFLQLLSTSVTSKKKNK